jgi:hypothetical protein
LRGPPVPRRATSASPAKSIRQGVCVPIPLPFPCRFAKSNTRTPSRMVFVFGSDHDFTYQIRMFCNNLLG